MFFINFIIVVRYQKRSESEIIMKKSTATINGEYLANLFEQKAEEILAKEKAPKTKKATKKVAEKSEVKEPKKKTIKAKAEKVEKVESEKSQSAKKVAKKAPKAVEKTAEKEPKKTTKKAKAEAVEQEAKEQELRSLTTIKVAKTEYILDDTIKNYDDLEKAVVEEKDIYVAFDISEVDSKEYENIFHTPFEKSMKEKFDICTPIFVGEKNRRLVFASIYTEALWDLFPDEFELLSAVLKVKETKKTKK